MTILGKPDFLFVVVKKIRNKIFFSRIQICQKKSEVFSLSPFSSLSRSRFFQGSFGVRFLNLTRNVYDEKFAYSA